MTWKILTSTPGATDTEHRATDGARVATCHLPNGTTPTDAHFTEALTFALVKWRTKMGR